MTKIAFLGLGAMGSRMASHLLDAGHTVTVWNRTIDRAQPLAAKGASVAPTPREAAAQADVVFSMVRDDDASSATWLDPQSGALAGMKTGAVGVECSTVSVGHIHGLREAFVAQGIGFADAPLAGSRPQADAGQLIFFVGSDDQTLETIRPLLDLMGGAVHHAGPVGAGATLKLMVNALFGAQLAIVAELIGFADRAGVNVPKAIEILGATPVCSPAAKGSAAAMLAGKFAPAFPIDLVAKDFDLVARSAEAVGAPVPVSKATAGVYRQGTATGFGDDNITGIVQLYRSQAA